MATKVIEAKVCDYCGEMIGGKVESVSGKFQFAIDGEVQNVEFPDMHPACHKRATNAVNVFIARLRIAFARNVGEKYDGESVEDPTA